MKKEDLFEAIGEIDARNVQRAEAYRGARKPVWVRWAAIAACVALLAGAFAAVPLLKRGGGDPSGFVAVRAQYPEPTAKKMSPQQFMEDEAHWKWLNGYYKKTEASAGLQANMDGYYAAIMGRTLASEDENTVCSPLNTYIAFAMLAEVSGGNTRQQVLDMLGASDIDTLRQNVTALWEGNYADTPVLTSLLANSLWLNNDVQYKDETLNTLAGQYYASSFRGEPGSKEMDEALQTWVDENTGGLLSEYVKDLELDKNTVLELLSTIYYKAVWTCDFLPQNTDKQVFHGTKGDTTVDMMHQSDVHSVCRTDTFTVLDMGLTDSGSMFFYLPDEGVDVSSLASDPEVFRVLRQDDGWSYPEVNLSLPKFEISEKTDLLDTVRSLGVVDALDPNVSDFTPLTQEADQIYLSKAEHAATVKIDEHGVIGAAYTALPMEAAGEWDESFDFVLDRPFLFVITGADGSVLFSGIVRNIE